MGMDNSTWIETRVDGRWLKAEIMDTHTFEWCGFPFEWRDYTMYAFLCDGTNSRVKGLPTGEWAYRGYPDDSEWLNQVVDDFYGSPVTRLQEEMDNDMDSGRSWVLLSELLAFDYDQLWESPRGPETVRENLGEMFFTHLELLKAYGAPDEVRVVYCFN